MALAEDLSVFFDTVNGFAEAVTYDGTPGVAMIFDAAFFEDALGRLGVNSAKPAALAQTAHVPAAAQGKLVVRAGVTYRVVRAEPDGTGITLLLLERV